MDAVRLLRVPLAGGCSVATAVRALAREPLPFALSGRWAGGGAIVGSSPLRVAAPGDDPFALLDELPALAPGDAASAPPDAVGGGWFGWLGYQLGARVEQLPPPPPRPVPLPPFQLAYYDHVLRRDDAGRWWFEALTTPAREPALSARLDHLRALIAGASDADRGADAANRSADAANHGADVADRGADAANRGADVADRGADKTAAGPRFRVAGDGAAAHLAAVADCRERIAAGELFQANICLRFEADWPPRERLSAEAPTAPAGASAGADPGAALMELHARALERLRPAYAALFPTPDGGIASLSPELFLRRRGRTVETAPIKGTIARDGDAERPAAAAARARLLASPKDHAEHVMIVDLMRNDLGRVSTYGSVTAAPAPEAEAHPGLWHLVSRVRGTLRPGVGDGELLRATFPPGSVTGAPKVHALHVIAALEATAREAYTGAVGYASPLAGLELNVAIRTFEAGGGKLWLGAGGGIVADSEPAAELEECHVKARPLIAAIGGTLVSPAQAPPPFAQNAPPSAQAAPPPAQNAPPPAQAAPPPAQNAPPPAQAAPPALRHPRRRPDPARGIFETLLVRDGVAVAADAHLARLAASARTLYGLALPPGLAEQVAAAAREADGGRKAAAAHRLRVTLTPGGSTAATTVTTAPVAARELPVVLVPFALPGGLGAHKWLDRDLLDELTAEARARTGAANATPLLLDGAGNVLEAAWASVVAVEHRTDGPRGAEPQSLLLTPPADGRILPSVSRARMLAAARAAGRTAEETALPLARLAAAAEIVLTSALGELPAVLASTP